MENEEYEEIVKFLVSDGKEIPVRLSGGKNKEKRKTFKCKCVNYKLADNAVGRNEKTRCLLKQTKSGTRVVLRQRDLEEVWQHFHVNATTGGHNGVYVMELTIQREYVMPKLRLWLSERKRECNVCRQTTTPIVPAPVASEFPPPHSAIAIWKKNCENMTPHNFPFWAHNFEFGRIMGAHSFWLKKERNFG